MVNMRRVLIIASDFVPSSLPPATRVRFLVKHLPEFGWEPIVLTVDPKHYEASVDAENEDLLAPSLKVVRTGAFSTRWTRKLGVGDIGMRSLWQHWRQLKRICKQQTINLVFIPVPPYVPMVLGRLARMRFGIPYVIDYIDPWVTDYYWTLPKSERPPKWALSDKLSRVLEPFALRRVSHITGVSEGTTESVVGRYPWLSEVQTTEIPYGAEAADFEHVRRHRRPNRIFDPDDGLFHLSYVGACPPSMHATIRALFAAMRAGRDRLPDKFERLRMHFIGTSYSSNGSARQSVTALAREAGLDNVDEQPARISYLDSLQVMLDSDALCLVGSDEPHYTASKVFPYMISGRPLLAIFHEASSVTRILNEQNRGRLVSFSSREPAISRVDEIFQKLADLISLPAANAASIGVNGTDSYSTRAMTRRLARAFDQAVK